MIFRASMALIALPATLAISAPAATNMDGLTGVTVETPAPATYVIDPVHSE
jgi:hypothetical protein